MKTFKEFVIEARKPWEKSVSTGRGPDRSTVPYRSDTLGMDKISRTQFNARERALRKGPWGTTPAKEPTTEELEMRDIPGAYKQRITDPSVNKGKPTEYKIKKFTVPGSLDQRRMPRIIDTMSTPREKQIKNFWKGSHTA
jgi:hypothetical protein